MKDLYQIIILAEPPESTPKDLRADGFIDDVATRFAKCGAHLQRAATIGDIDSALTAGEAAANKEDKDLAVQIVGHGSAGQLLLGMTWSQESPRNYPFLVVDTGPIALGLLRLHRGLIRELTLVGCYVGSAEESELAVTGRSLTFVVGELLQCKVTGATALVGESDFDSDGLYTGERAGWDWIAGEIRPCTIPSRAPVAAPMPAASPGKTKELHIEEITRTLLPVGNPGPHVDIMVAARVMPLGMNPKLKYATPEVTVKIADVGTAAVVANGRYLVTPTEHYAVAEPAELTKKLREYLWRPSTGASRAPARPA
jgi:hypothetical protein